MAGSARRRHDRAAMAPRKPCGSTYSTSPSFDTCCRRKDGAVRRPAVVVAERENDVEGLQCRKPLCILSLPHRQHRRCTVHATIQRSSVGTAGTSDPTCRVPCESAASACSACSASEGVTPARAETSPTVTCNMESYRFNEDEIYARNAQMNQPL